MGYRLGKRVDRTDRSVVRDELDRILGSADFDASRRSREFLRFIVEETLAGRGSDLTQASIATRVFERKDDFDALLDPIVRIQAGRLRRSLERYYLLAGKKDAVAIDVPRGAYVPVFRMDREPDHPSPSPASGATPRSPHPHPPSAAPVEWPSVAVDRIASDDQGDGQTAATRVKEELTLELCRYRDVRVILRADEDKLDPSRPGQAQFELRGRLRREGDGWRLVARLVDRTSGEQVWGEEYRTSSAPDDLDDAARVVAARVAAENGVIVQTIAGSRRKHTLGAGGYAGVLRSHIFFFARDVADFEGAVEGLRETVREQPEIALAWAHLARLYMVNYSFELTARPTPIEDAVSFASQAVRLDPTNTRVRCLLASALLIKGERAAAREEVEETLRLNARSLVFLEITGYVLSLCGEWDRGIDLMRTAMRRNPHHLPHVYVALWADAMRRGEFAEAYAFALENRDPMFFWRSLMRTSALGQLGRTEEAADRAAELVREKPGFAERGRILIGHYLKAPGLEEVVIDGLRKAGLSLA